MKRAHFTLILFVSSVIILLLFKAPSVGYLQPENPGKLGGFTYWDSELYPGSNGVHVSWLDDETVVWMGPDAPKPLFSSEARSLQEEIIVWRLGSKPHAIDDPRWHTIRMQPLGGGGGLCAHNGIIQYEVGQEGPIDGKITKKIVVGPPDHLEERNITNLIPFETRYLNSVYPQFNKQGRDVSCSYLYDESLRAHYWISDDRDRFILDLGKSSPSKELGPVRVIDRWHEQPDVIVDTDGKDIIPFETQYHSFNGHFFIVENVTGDFHWSQENPCLSAWDINPLPFLVVKTCIVYNKDLGLYYPEVLPTKIGLIIAVTGPSTRKGWGIYTLENNNYLLQISGFIRNIAVSPNGCRLAFPYAKRLDDMMVGLGRYSVVAVDLCEKGNKQ